MGRSPRVFTRHGPAGTGLTESHPCAFTWVPTMPVSN